jgi:hypothetical protein
LGRRPEFSVPSDAELRAGRPLLESATAPDTSKATKHKKWVKEVEAAQLTRLLQHDEAEVRKALKKPGFGYRVEELEFPALAPTPTSQQVVLYKREGKLVGYAVGVTSTDAQEPSTERES